MQVDLIVAYSSRRWAFWVDLTTKKGIRNVSDVKKSVRHKCRVAAGALFLVWNQIASRGCLC